MLLGVVLVKLSNLILKNYQINSSTLNLIRNTVLFASVDVDKVPQVCEEAGITAMPTFNVYKGGKMIQQIRGADKNKLEQAIKVHLI